MPAGESKEYIYPNQRPATGWYHDHSLHITLENAYHGLAGFMLMSDQLKHGGCGAPYNLEVQAKGQLLYHWLQHQIETLPEC
jgi:FtsP/CotA-like multicopper oxidase with cupredoxin domain